MQELNLDVAGEFLVMAATLIHIKSQMLLPRPETAAGVEARRGGSARRARPPAARAPEVQGGRRAAARARDSCAARSGMRPDERRRRDRRRRLRAGARSRSVQPARRVPGGARARQAAAAGGAAAGADLDRESASTSCSRGCRRPRRAGSRICSPTSTTAAGLIVTFLALLEMIRLKLVRVFQSGQLRRRFASTSARGRPTRRIRLAIRRHTVAEDERTADDGRTSRTGRSRRIAGSTTDATRRPRRCRRRRAELKAIVEALIFASPEPLTPKALFKLLDRRAEGRRRGGDRGAEARLRATRPGCSWWRWPAAIRSSPGPTCTNGCAGCSTSGRRRS